jgi:two-component system cell cycle sensor histidine kinase/response regulator CckA
MARRASPNSRVPDRSSDLEGLIHDLNNLLSAMLGSCEFTLREFAGDARLQPLLRSLQAAGEIASCLARRTAQFESSHVRQPVELNRLVERMAGILTPMLGHQVRVISRLPRRPAWIAADPTDVARVILNLALNARDAMPQGGTLTLTVRHRRSHPSGIRRPASANLSSQAPSGQDYAELAITDTGCGMDGTTRRRAFEAGFSTKLPGAGTGIGLVVVKELVRRNGAALGLESQPGHGTTFRIRWRCAADGRQNASQESGSSSVKALAPGRGTVLVVEDNARLREVTSKILRGQGYEVIEARGGIEALKLASGRGARVDLLVADLALPDGSGSTLARRLRRRQPQMKVLLMSGYAPPGAPDDSCTFLPKPFRPSELVSCVERMLALEGGAREPGAAVHRRRDVRLASRRAPRTTMAKAGWKQPPR